MFIFVKEGVLEVSKFYEYIRLVINGDAFPLLAKTSAHQCQYQRSKKWLKTNSFCCVSLIAKTNDNSVSGWWRHNITWVNLPFGMLSLNHTATIIRTMLTWILSAKCGIAIVKISEHGTYHERANRIITGHIRVEQVANKQHMMQLRNWATFENVVSTWSFVRSSSCNRAHVSNLEVAEKEIITGDHLIRSLSVRTLDSRSCKNSSTLHSQAATSVHSRHLVYSCRTFRFKYSKNLKPIKYRGQVKSRQV